ncbi:hypothetical protein ABPG72_001997 [Tetrahymena utriculariae]
MDKKENVALLLHTENYKLVVFKYANGKYGFLRQKLTEEDDNFCPPLGITRHILTQISGGFRLEMFTQEVQLEQNCDVLKRLYNLNDWHKLWMSYEYNSMCDQICQFSFSEVLVDNSNYQIYYHKINHENFSLNMKKLGVEIMILHLGQIKQLPDIDEATSKIISANINFQSEIQQQIELENSPNSKENTFIFIQNKPIDLKSKLDKGIPDMPTKAFYYGIFKKSKQKWLPYNSGTHHLPTDEVLENSKAIIQSGAASSAYEEQEWIISYREWLNKVYFKYPHLKFLSICFGEQVLAHSLNGKCEEVEERKQNKQFYNIKTEALNFDDSFFSFPYVCKLNVPKKPIFISKAHGDIVSKIDTTLFKVIASSENYHVEVFTDATNQGNKVLAFQGHPEYAGKWKMRKDSQYFALYLKKPVEEAYEFIKKSRETSQVDDFHLLRLICSSFLQN